MYRVGLVDFGKETKEMLVNIQNQIPEQWKLEIIHSKEQALQKKFDLIILVELSMRQAASICEYLFQLKNETNALLWVWSKLENETNRIVYLKLGADGINFDERSTEEQLLIMSNGLKRQKHFNTESASGLEVSKIDLYSLDARNYTFQFGNKKISLSRIEYMLLEILYKHVGQTVSYPDLLKAMWPKRAVDEAMICRISNVICHLRKKISKNEGDPQMIKTVRSLGYLLKSVD